MNKKNKKSNVALGLISLLFGIIILTHTLVILSGLAKFEIIEMPSIIEVDIYMYLSGILFFSLIFIIILWVSIEEAIKRHKKRK